jgi:dUTP pyrophosphatase
MVKIKIKKIRENATIPSYAHSGDAGMDVYSCVNLIIAPGKRALIPLGIAMEIPEGYVALVWDKSGLALKKGIHMMAGVGDCGYRGEYSLVILNTSEEPYEVKAQEKIAQILIQPIETVEIEEVKNLSDSSRGKGGFGSTGIN